MELVTAQAKDGLYAALLAVQAKLPHLQRTKINPAFRSKYVPLEELHEEVLPLLNEHGLVWVTQPKAVGALVQHGELMHVVEQPCLHYRLIHAETGEEIEGLMPLLLDKQNPQGQGSAITYARRYSLMAVLGLVADDDDDGNAASGKPRGRQQGKRETRRNPEADKAKAASRPEDAPRAYASPPRVIDQVNPTTLREIKDSFTASGLSKEAFAEILSSAGAGSTPISELSQEKASWVLVALRERIDADSDTAKGE